MVSVAVIQWLPSRWGIGGMCSGWLYLLCIWSVWGWFWRFLDSIGLGKRIGLKLIGSPPDFLRIVRAWRRIIGRSMLLLAELGRFLDGHGYCCSVLVPIKWWRFLSTFWPLILRLLASCVSGVNSFSGGLLLLLALLCNSCMSYRLWIGNDTHFSCIIQLGSCSIEIAIWPLTLYSFWWISVASQISYKNLKYLNIVVYSLFLVYFWN